MGAVLLSWVSSFVFGRPLPEHGNNLNTGF